MPFMRMLWQTIKESFKSVFRHGWLSISAILSITVTLLLTATLLIISLNVQSATTAVAQGLTASVYLRTEVDEAQAQVLAQQIAGLNNVKDVKFSNKDEQLTKVLNNLDETNRALLEGYREANPLNDVLIVTMTQPNLYNALKRELEQTYPKQIEDIKYQEEVANNVLPVFSSIRFGAFILILVVAFVATILISNTIRITIVARRTEIGVMRLVAASNWYIRTPFLIEGVLLGLIGALIATGVSVSIYHYYSPTLLRIFSFGTSGVIIFTKIIFQEVLLWTTVIGGAIGLVGSFFPVRKYLKK